MSKPLNIIVTGASGFIGKNITLKLLQDNFHVYGVSRKINHSFRHPGLRWITWDNYKESLNPEIKIHAVINLVTTYGHNNESYDDIFKCNVVNPLGLIKHAISLGAKKIINADSFFRKPQYKYKHLIDYINTKNILIEELKKLLIKEDIMLANMRLEHVWTK